MPSRTSEPDPSSPLRELWNLSDVTAGWLEELGIHAYGDLQGRDLHELWLELKARHRQVTKLMFYALWGAVHNCHWNQIPQSEIDAFEEFRKGSP